ncbi:MAG TPA: hypothetical protein PLQ74_10940 [Pseudomonadota bacterium]|nr:hypothetical protein [Pseudomonadota bacterium]
MREPDLGVMGIGAQGLRERSCLTAITGGMVAEREHGGEAV